MEFVEGRNLREVLESGPLPPRRIARLLRQLASALDAIHAAGICHRDVKPENIIIRREDSPEEEAVLIDFSIAIVKDANETLYGPLARGRQLRLYGAGAVHGRRFHAT